MTLETPSTRIAAAKNTATTSQAVIGCEKASNPKITLAMPPTRNTHQVRLHRVLASPPSLESSSPSDWAIDFLHAR